MNYLLQFVLKSVLGNKLSSSSFQAVIAAGIACAVNWLATLSWLNALMPGFTASINQPMLVAAVFSISMVGLNFLTNYLSLHCKNQLLVDIFDDLEAAMKSAPTPAAAVAKVRNVYVPPPPNSGAAKSLMLLAALLLAPCSLLLSGCNDAEITAALPLITDGAAAGTASSLQLSNATQATRNDVYDIGVAVYSLADGTVPTPSALQSRLAQYVTDPGAQAIAGLAQALYSEYYAQIGTNGQSALQVLEAIAAGVEQGAGAATAEQSAALMRRLPPQYRIVLWQFVKENRFPKARHDPKLQF